MAVGMLLAGEAVTKDTYRQVTEKMFGSYPMPEEDSPEGLIMHTAGQSEQGWYVYDIWESKEQFYTLFPELQYAQAWSMVHFFMHAKGGKYKPLLERYLKVLKETRSTAEARAVFPTADLPAMQREWVSYVKSLK